MSSSSKNTIRVGTRNSQLAKIQTMTVVKMLEKVHRDTDFKIVPMTTTGDNILDIALAKIGEKNLFTKELELALERKEVDIIVHSLKDLPTSLPDGLVIGAVCRRDDPRDAVVMHPKHFVTHLKDLPHGSVVGSSSLRRQSQVKKKFPNLKFEDVRGNLNTRKRKLDEDDKYDCLILAKAGLDRMGWTDRISSVLDPESECMYAVCQGAMAVECRQGDQAVYSLLGCIQDKHTSLQCVAERSFLKTLEGGCSVPIGVFSSIENETLRLCGGVYSINGEQQVHAVHSADLPADHPLHSEKDPAPGSDLTYCSVIATEISPEALHAAESLGIALAKKMLSKGAKEIVDTAKKTIAAEIIKEKAEKARKELQKQ